MPQAGKASREAPAAHSWAMSRNVVEAVDEDWSTSDQERRVGLNARAEAVSSRAKMANEWVRSARTKCESDHSNTKLRAQRVVANCLPAWVATKTRQRGVAHAREKNGGDATRSARGSSPLKTCTSDAASFFWQIAWWTSAALALALAKEGVVRAECRLCRHVAPILTTPRELGRRRGSRRRRPTWRHAQGAGSARSRVGLAWRA